MCMKFIDLNCQLRIGTLQLFPFLLTRCHLYGASNQGDRCLQNPYLIDHIRINLAMTTRHSTLGLITFGQPEHRADVSSHSRGSEVTS